MNLVRRVQTLEARPAMLLVPPAPVPFETPADAVAVIAECVNLVRADPFLDPSEKARTLGFLSSVGLRAMAQKDMAAAGGGGAGPEGAEAGAAGRGEEAEAVLNAHPTNLYEQFQPPERLTLLIEAMARDDEAEARRLQDACPRLSYTGPDVEFTERYTLAFDIMSDEHCRTPEED